MRWDSSAGAPIRSPSATNDRTCRSTRSRSAASGSPTTSATPFTCTARAIVGGLNPTATAPFRSRFARIREPSGAVTHSLNDRPSADTSGPHAACELRPQLVVTRGDPHGNAAVDELDHIRIEHGRHLRPLHDKEPTLTPT